MEITPFQPDKDLANIEPHAHSHEHDHAETLEELDARLRRLTVATLESEFHGWLGSEPLKPRDKGRWLCFLGTGGSPRNLLTQVRRTGGFILNLPDFCLSIDPGPGAIYHANYFGLDPTALDAVYVSHAHTDHYTEAATMIEAMCKLMSLRKGVVLAPSDVLDNGYISQFHQGKGTKTGPYRGGPASTIAMQADKGVALGGVTLTPHRAYHGGENYGFTLEYQGWRMGYTSDTAYIRSYRTKAGLVVAMDSNTSYGEMSSFEDIVDYHADLKENYNNLDVLIANVGYYHLFAHRHFSAQGLIHMLQNSQVKLCIITHLDSLYFTNPGLAQDMARYVQEKSGVRCFVPEEGVKIEL